MKSKYLNTKVIVGTGILTAIEIVLYIVGANFAIGGVNINLALVPICVGAILYGPICGGFLGLVNGISVLLTPITETYFMNTDYFGNLCILGTFIICLTKCTVAGIICYFICKPFKNQTLGSIISSLSVPILNTGLFIAGAAIFYKKDFNIILSGIITFNFLIEILTTLILSPAIARIITYQRHIIREKKSK